MSGNPPNMIAYTLCRPLLRPWLLSFDHNSLHNDYSRVHYSMSKINEKRTFVSILLHNRCLPLSDYCMN